MSNKPRVFKPEDTRLIKPQGMFLMHHIIWRIATPSLPVY